MMARMLTQVPLPLLPGTRRSRAGGGHGDRPGRSGVVWVHGLATFAWDAGGGRRLAAVRYGG